MSDVARLQEVVELLSAYVKRRCPTDTYTHYSSFRIGEWVFHVRLLTPYNCECGMVVHWSTAYRVGGDEQVYHYMREWGEYVPGHEREVTYKFGVSDSSSLDPMLAALRRADILESLAEL